MLKKQKKTKEERIAENFFPVNPADLKKTVEKEYKKPDRKSLEKVETTKEKPKKRTKKPKTKKIEYKPKKIKLKKDGYELVVTEKPQAALKIASALGKSTKKNEKGIPYYEVERNGEKIIVACAVGHLFTLNQTKPRSTLPVFDITWVPNYIVRTRDFSKKYYDTLLKLMKGAGSLTVATDYDIEGETIGLNVVRFIGGQKDASRMKFSTLTDKELNKAYEEKSPSINWGQAIAGETRHYLDWFYGINLSRALMNAIKTTGKFRIISIGRVQGPALNLIVKKEKEIQAFESVPYWQVSITIDKPRLELLHNKDIFDKSGLKKFENLIGKIGEAETKKTEQHLPPNPPFNLTTLQTEAYRFHGITPSKTLQIAQSLYLSGLISYPRTSSQKLPESINYREIIKRIEGR
jgi:DNA topoisomerase-1